jgi:hypothetical protein
LPHESVALDIRPSPNASFFLFFNNTISIFHHDRHCQEMTGNQIIPLHAAKSTENDWQEN